jgi:5-methyltetrahydrofolate--homocysteine methyltransferase
VLSCNNYEVIDLGVMVPADRILSAAKETGADIIGLSGLITPSLEEMVHVAREMERQGFTLPLLIGGATTSEVHTAVKIEPAYSGPVVQVRDASKAVGVVSGLLSEDYPGRLANEVKKKYETLRNNYNKQSDYSYISLSDARKNRFRCEWNNLTIKRPLFTGPKAFTDFPLEDLVPYIDWTFFFHAWKMNGKFPAILNDPLKGTEARKLFDDAQRLLTEITQKKMLIARGTIAFYPCNSNGDDIEIFTDEMRSRKISTLRFLRNQQLKEAGQPNVCLADFVAPRESGIIDYIGGFAVTAGLGVEEWATRYEQELDDYNAIMVKILADRLAEAFAEQMHHKVRTEYWGYDPKESLTIENMLREEYRGIRPAPGYPACPEHSEKQTLFDLLDATKNTGITLTENFAMYPGASVCGYYFSHPGSMYFNLGKIGKDQITEYARRKNISTELAEKLLNTNLNY